MQLRVKVSSGLGGGGEVRLGWTDTHGYRMLGVGGSVQAGLHMGATVFAGMHFALTSIKVEIGVGNFDFYYIIPLFNKAKSEQMLQEALKGTNAKAEIAK